MQSSFWGAVFLIAGTCIGGGMLALPVDTALAGFIPSFVAMLLCWMFMTLTGLLIVEATLWMKDDVHMMNISSRILGPVGKYSSLVLFLFMGYASLVAYTTGGAVLFDHFFEILSLPKLSHATSCLLFVSVFGLAFYLRKKGLGKLNTCLVAGMIISYVLLVILGATKVQAPLLLRRDWVHAVPSFPIILTIFSFQMIVPSLTPYVNRDPKLLRKAIFLGTSIPFIVYLLWEWIILGSVPFDGSFGLLQAIESGSAATEPFRRVVQNPWLVYFADSFAFFAIVTSFIGIGLSLFDFLSDSFSIQKTGKHRIFLMILVLLPSFLFAVWFPKAFLLSLEFSGGYGDALLNGILPVAMVFVGRYWQNRTSAYQVLGGKFSLGFALLFSVVVLLVQTWKIWTYYL